MADDAEKEGKAPLKTEDYPQLFLQQFSMTCMVGKGGFSKVYGCSADAARKKEFGEGPFVAKVINTSEKYGKDVAMNEIRVMETLSACPNAARLRTHYSQEDKSAVVLLMDKIEGIEMFDYLDNHEGKRIPEAKAKLILYKLLAALQHCHAHNIAHRDIKDQNVMLSINEADFSKTSVFLIDFGWWVNFAAAATAAAAAAALLAAVLLFYFILFYFILVS